MPDSPSSIQSAEIKITGNSNLVSLTGDIQVVTNANPVDVHERGKLSTLLTRVRLHWIEGRLERSLARRSFIKQDMEFLVGASNHFSDKDFQNEELSTIFHKTGSLMLILGDAGFGKTTILLDLARQLIRDIDQDLLTPVPVVLSLSSWSPNYLSFEDWLIKEISRAYKAGGKDSCSLWITQNRLLFFLDGLDEIDSDDRVACVESINRFQEDIGVAGMVVSCRRSVYENLSAKLNLNCAVFLQPLREEQIMAYLSGSQFDTLRTTLSHNTSLRKLALSPLILWILSMTFENRSTKRLESISDLEFLWKELFSAYVENMFDRKQPATGSSSKHQITAWLSWLARKMRNHNQTVFLIEELQPSWLSHGERRAYALVSRLIVGIVLGFVFGYIAVGIGGLFFMMFVWLCAGFTCGVSAGLVHACQLELDTSQNKTSHSWLRRLTIPTTAGLLPAIIGLAMGELTLWSYGYGRILSVLDDPFTGLLFATATIAIFGLRNMNGSTLSDIQTFERLNWSARGALQGLIAGLIIATVLILVFVLAIQQTTNISTVAILLFLILAGAGLIYGGAKGGAKAHTVKVSPNEGIKLTLKTMLMVLTFVMIEVLLMVSVLIVTLGISRSWSLITVILIFGSLLGMVLALRKGGLDIVQHYTIRCIMYKAFPFNYARFLDPAVDLIFLERVGGGFIFVHKFLLDHFADQKRLSVN